MRVPFSILLLGLWLARKWQICRGQWRYPKPAISVASSDVVLGGTATIYCSRPEVSQKTMTFSLYKVENSFSPPLRLKEWEVSNTAAFTITNATLADRGRYVCQYCSLGYYVYCSEYSDYLSLKIIGQLHPKPSIAVIPSGVVSVGQNIIIHCESQGYPQAEFFLHKKKTSFSYSSRVMQKLLAREAAFSIPNAQQSETGIYQCSYCFQSEFYRFCSDFSDQVHINMRDPSLPKPSMKVRPREQIPLGSNVTMECWAPESELNFSLYNSSALMASQVTKPGRNRTQFLFFMVRLEDAGNYSCQYHRRSSPFLWSELSDPVELLVTSQDQDRTKSIGATAIILISTSGGLVLLLLLLLLVFVLCRKRRKGSTANERNQPMNLATEINTGEAVEPDGITYAELSNCSFKTKQTAVPYPVGESCVYASIAQDKNRASQ